MIRPTCALLAVAHELDVEVGDGLVAGGQRSRRIAIDVDAHGDGTGAASRSGRVIAGGDGKHRDGEKGARRTNHETP